MVSNRVKIYLPKRLISVFLRRYVFQHTEIVYELYFLSGIPQSQLNPQTRLELKLNFLNSIVLKV